MQVDDQSPHFETEQALLTANAETDEQKRQRIDAQDALVREWITERRRRGVTAARPRAARPASAADLAAVGIKLVRVPRRPLAVSPAPGARVACSTPRLVPAARSSLGRRTSSGQRRTASASSSGGGSSGEPGEPSADPPRRREGRQQQVGRRRGDLTPASEWVDDALSALVARAEAGRR